MRNILSLIFIGHVEYNTVQTHLLNKCITLQVKRNTLSILKLGFVLRIALHGGLESIHYVNKTKKSQPLLFGSGSCTYWNTNTNNQEFHHGFILVFNLMRKTLKQHFVNFISEILILKHLEIKQEATRKIWSIQIYVIITLKMKTSKNEGTLHSFIIRNFFKKS